jgi:O-succinylbenzoate synthase
LFSHDVTSSPLVPADGALEPRRVSLDEAAAAQVEADAERTEWWRNRLTRCFALIEADAQA